MSVYTMKIKKPKAPSKRKEKELADLLAVVPVLRKHKKSSTVEKAIRQLREKRKQTNFTIELSRDMFSYSPEADKFEALDVNASGMTVNFLTERKINKTITVENKAKTRGTTQALLKKMKDELVEKIKEKRSKNKEVDNKFTFSEGVTVPKSLDGLVYKDENTFIKLLHRRVRTSMRKARKPATQDNYVGVEIEFAANKDVEEICDIFFEAGLGKFINVKQDTSIKVSRDCPFQIEMNVIAKESEIFGVIEKLCAILNAQVKIYLDTSCGLHIHLDMRNKEHKKAYSNLVLSQHFLYAMNPGYRLTGKYSIPVKSKKIEDNDSHYDGISGSSYHKYKTIELRMHSGTTNATKINSWIKLLLQIVDAPKMEGVVTSPTLLRGQIGLTEELTTYLVNRIAKFSKQHSKIKAEAYPFLPKVDVVEGTADLNQEELSEAG